jgi:methylated-DNA-[protein]-cysteine S-methyltransferase
MRETKKRDQGLGGQDQYLVNSERFPDERKEILGQALKVLFGAEPAQESFDKARQKLNQTLENAKMDAIYYGKLEHEMVGNLYLAIHNSKLITVDFGVSEADFVCHIEKDFGMAPYFDTAAVQPLSAQVQEYLNGERSEFNIPCDLSGLTPFQRQVLLATLEIPRGQILTYGDIARQIGNPKSVRAVGQALGRNPIPIVIPCHRVIAANGSLGGYSGGGGLETKAKLLQIEGALLG